VAAEIEKQPDVIHYHRACKIDTITRDPATGVPRHTDGSYLTISAFPDKRTSYLVQSKCSAWCVILRTVDWCQEVDCDWVQDVAKRLAARLNTTAISISGDYTCDLRIFEASKLVKKKGGELDQIAKIIGEYGIDVPDCSIAEDPPRLFATKNVADGVELAHRLELKVE
jgi:hypothetical protein